MKFRDVFILFSILALNAILANAASTTHSPIVRSTRADVTCNLAEIGRVHFNVDLNRMEASWAPADATTGEYVFGKGDKLTVESHFAYRGSRRLDSFDLGYLNSKPGSHIANLILRGDNADDTDYLLLISYEPACQTREIEQGKCETSIAVHSSLTTYIDSMIGSATTGDKATVKEIDCAMELN